MQTIRLRSPLVCRVSKTVPVYSTRNMSFFPRFPAGEFAPLFRLLDDYASHSLTREPWPNAQHLRSFQPRFDVKENQDSYELQGELPGVEQQNLTVEFTDPQTLTIKGRSERRRRSGTPPAQVEHTPAAQLETAQPEQPATADNASDTSVASANYHKATVEEEDGTSTTTATADGVQTPATETEAPAQQTQEVAQPAQPKQRYWVSERSVGEFSRTFNFPSRVDQDNVKAGLKNGILSIVVPKAAAPVNKRVTIE